MIFDTHAHYDSEDFETDCEEILNQLPKNGVSGVLNLGLNLETSKSTIKLAQKNDFIYAAVGLHPLEIDRNSDSFFDELEKLVNIEKVVAIGEIGLDYYHSPQNSDLQKEIFSKQIEFANEKKLPICVHDRLAHDDTIKILEKLVPRGVVHCFSGDIKMAEKVLDLGMYLGIGFILTFENAAARILEEVVKFAPIDKILLETDVPYLAPKPFRGKRCDSSYLKIVAERIAKIKKIPVKDVYKTTDKNAKKVFDLI